MTALAESYRLHGRLDEAEKLFNEALPMITAQKGPDHAATLITLNNLSLLYTAQERHKEACELLEKALAGLEEQCSVDSLDLLCTLDNLATAYSCLGRVDEAEALFKQAFTARVQYRGSEHPTTLNTMVCFAQFYRDNDRYHDAQVLCERVLAARKRQLGPRHASTLDAQYKLRCLYLNQERYAEALSVAQALVAGLGDSTKNHDEASMSDAAPVSTYNRISWQLLLVSVLVHVKRHDEAETLQQELLAILNNETNMNDHCEFYADGLYHMALIRNRQSRYNDAESLLRQALALENIDKDSRGYLAFQDLLISVLENQHRQSEAEEILQSHLSDTETTCGPSSLPTASALVRLGFLYENLSRWPYAADVMIRALNIREETLGENHNETSVPLQAIAFCREQMGDTAGAVDMWQRALLLMERKQGRGDQDTIVAVKRLLNALHYLGKEGEETKWSEWAREGGVEFRLRKWGGEDENGKVEERDDAGSADSGDDDVIVIKESDDGDLGVGKLGIDGGAGAGELLATSSEDSANVCRSV